MEKFLLIVLAVLAAACAAMLHWGPVNEYAIECQRAIRISCLLERSKASGTETWRFEIEPGTRAMATVRIVPRRRSSSNVYLYIVGLENEVFVAEFEGSNDVSDAKAAAAQLNQVLLSTVAASTRIEVRPPAYLRWMSWGFLALMVLIIVSSWLKLNTRDSSPRRAT